MEQVGVHYHYHNGHEPNLEAACIVFLDMIGSTHYWASAFENEKGLQDGGLRNAWRGVSSDQTTIMATMLNPDYNGSFVKGVGDQLIFRFQEVSAALSAANSAWKKLQSIQYRKINGHRSFRFVIHWAEQQLITGWYDLLTRSLRGLALEQCDNNICEHRPFHDPQSPDLFGHHMNYASRCITMVSIPGILLTAQAHKKHLDETGNFKPKLSWPIVLAGAKGMTHETLILRRIVESYKDDEDNRSSVAAYKTKALVVAKGPLLDANKTQTMFYEASEVMRVKKSRTLDEEAFARNIFLAFYTNEFSGEHELPKDGESLIRNSPIQQKETTKDHKEDIGQVANQLIFRIECVDAEYLDRIFTDNETAIKIFKIPLDNTGLQLNTETRFIRTAKPREGRGQQWVTRNFHEESFLYYLEIQPLDLKDIDEYAERIINGYGDGLLEAIDVARLWGKPSIYAILKIRSGGSDIPDILQALYRKETDQHCNGARVQIWKIGDAKSMKSQWEEK